MRRVKETLRLLKLRAAPRVTAIGQALRRRLEEGFVRAFASLATSVYRVAGDWRGWRPLLTRTSAHLAVLSVAIIAIGLSNVEWRAQAAPVLSMSALPVAAEGGESEEAAKDLLINGEDHVANSNGIEGAGQSVTRLAQPHTNIPWRPRLSIITYTIQPGDTVQGIASTFVLSPTTIMWANPAIEDAPDLLRLGQEVIILPVDGAYHTVVEGDTLESIAEKYEVEVEAIINCQYNPLKPPRYAIEEGMRLIVPHGKKPYIPKVVTSYTGAVPEGARGTGRFQWPVLGRITQNYWQRHRAIDIGAPVGSAILAADSGFVSFAGWTDVGYGNLVVIDHANGFVTYYAHQSTIYVSEGQAIKRGQVIGAVGNTGWSTGPHLHFEVRYYGEQHNPRAYLP